PESDHSITVPRNLEASILIVYGKKRVLSAIDLNDQLRCRAGEIHNVSTIRMLAAKSVRELELAQLPPCCRSASVMSRRSRRARVVLLLTITRSASERRHTRPAARRQPGSARSGRDDAHGSDSSPSSPRLSAR